MTSARYRLAPQLADVDQQTYRWNAYVMRNASPNYRSRSLNTDEHGLRVCHGHGIEIHFEEFYRWNGPKGVIAGNSTAFGVGCTSDTKTTSNLLNANDENHILWYNLATRASVMTQERYTMEFLAPDDLKVIVWISGANDMIAALLSDRAHHYAPPFIGEPFFSSRMNEKHSYSDAIAFDPNHIFPNLVNNIRRELTLLSTIRRQQGTKILFCLQPIVSWLDKHLSEEEHLLITEFDQKPARLHQIYRDKNFLDWYIPYSTAIRRICEEKGIDFRDFNAHPSFRGPEWLFVDRVHLTDAGNRIFADVIHDWVKNRVPDFT